MEKQSKMRRFVNNEQGSIIITFALVINTLILAVALSLDLGRAYMASSAISGALNAASMASAVNDGDAVKAQEYFVANLPNGTLGIGYDYATDVTHVVSNNSVIMDASGFEVPAYLSPGNTGNATVATGGGVTVGLSSGGIVPFDVVFVIDKSGSMHGSSGSGGSKWQAVDTAIKNFIDYVYPNQAIGPDGLHNYRFSINSYGSSYGVTYDFEHDKQTVLNQLATVWPAGGATCAMCGIRLGKEVLIDEAIGPNGALDRRRIVIILTDGMFNQADQYMLPHPLPPNYDGNTPPNNFTASPYANAAKECYSVKNLAIMDPNTGQQYGHKLLSGGPPQAVTNVQDVAVWTVRFGSGANGGQNLAIMNYCADDPSQSLYAQTGTELNQIFQLIVQTYARLRFQR